MFLLVFFESDNYHSFNRVINAWSFRRKSTGPDRGSYFHELFLRGKPHLQKYMRRLPRTHKKLAMAKSEEPDFFELHKTSPLPTLEQARLNLESRKFMRLRDQFGKEAVVQGNTPDGSRSPLVTTSNDANSLDQQAQNIQAKQRSLKHIESWREDQANLAKTTHSTFQYRHNGETKERVEQSGMGINRTATGQNTMKLPETLFRFPKDERIKDGLDLQSHVSGHSLLQQPQHHHQQEQACAVHQQVQVGAAMMRQQEQQLLARHHRAQMMQQIGQEQYLRVQGVRQAELVQQQQNQINLLRQMDFLQQQQRTGF